MTRFSSLISSWFLWQSVVVAVAVQSLSSGNLYSQTSDFGVCTEIKNAIAKGKIVLTPAGQSAQSGFKKYDIKISGKKIGSVVRLENTNGHISILIRNHYGEGIDDSEMAEHVRGTIVAAIPVAFSMIDANARKILGMAFLDGNQVGYMVQPGRMDGGVIVRSDGSMDIFNKNSFNSSILYPENQTDERISKVLKPLFNLDDYLFVQSLFRTYKSSYFESYLVISSGVKEKMKPLPGPTYFLAIDAKHRAAIIKTDSQYSNNDAIAIVHALGFQNAVLGPGGSENELNGTNRIIFFEK